MIKVAACWLLPVPTLSLCLSIKVRKCVPLGQRAKLHHSYPIYCEVECTLKSEFTPLGFDVLPVFPCSILHYGHTLVINSAKGTSKYLSLAPMLLSPTLSSASMTVVADCTFVWQLTCFSSVARRVLGAAPCTFRCTRWVTSVSNQL